MKYRYKDAEFIHIAIDKELKEKLKEEAKAKGISLNGYIRMILLERENK